MNVPVDGRRVCDMSPLELLEAAISGWERFGWTTGHWSIELHLENGHVRRALPQLLDERPSRATVGRRQLDEHTPGEAAA